MDPVVRHRNRLRRIIRRIGQAERTGGKDGGRICGNGLVGLIRLRKETEQALFQSEAAIAAGEAVKGYAALSLMRQLALANGNASAAAAAHQAMSLLDSATPAGADIDELLNAATREELTALLWAVQTKLKAA